MTQAQAAAYRVALKRILRASGRVVDNYISTPDLAGLVRLVASGEPGLVGKMLADKFKAAASAWERGNNSGNNAGLQDGKDECDRLRRTACAVLALWGVKVTFPGLYPAFEREGHIFYDTQSLMLDIAGHVKATACFGPLNLSLPIKKLSDETPAFRRRFMQNVASKRDA